MKNLSDYKTTVYPLTCMDNFVNTLHGLYNGKKADEAVKWMSGDDSEFYQVIFPLINELKAAFERQQKAA